MFLSSILQGTDGLIVPMSAHVLFAGYGSGDQGWTGP